MKVSPLETAVAVSKQRGQFVIHADQWSPHVDHPKLRAHQAELNSAKSIHADLLKHVLLTLLGFP